MNILVVAPRFPWPLDKADRMTVYHFLKHFSERHVLDLVAFGEKGFGDDFKPEYIKHVKPFCRKIEIVPLRHSTTCVQEIRSVFDRDPLQVWYFRRTAMFKKVRKMLESNAYDLVYTHLLRMAQYTQGFHGVPKVLALQISLALEYKRYAEHQDFFSNPLRKWLYRVEAQKLRTYEAQMAKQFDRTLLIGEADKQEVVRNGGDASNIFLNPHGVDLERFTPRRQEKAERSIGVSGNMHTAANIDAVLWFYYRVLPIVRRQIPDVRLFVIGSSPSKKIQKLAKDPSVLATGYVKDLAGFLGKCEVVVDPLRIGAGFQNKILEAMALELPVVATPTANEGIQASDGEQILVANNETEFASQVVALLRNSELREKLGRNGRKFVLANFTWKQHYDDLERELLILARANQDHPRTT